MLQTLSVKIIVYNNCCSIKLLQFVNWAMPKSIWEFWKPKKGRKVAIFVRIRVIQARNATIVVELCNLRSTKSIMENSSYESLMNNSYELVSLVCMRVPCGSFILRNSCGVVYSDI